MTQYDCKNLQKEGCTIWSWADLLYMPWYISKIMIIICNIPPWREVLKIFCIHQTLSALPYVNLIFKLTIKCKYTPLSFKISMHNVFWSSSNRLKRYVSIGVSKRNWVPLLLITWFITPWMNLFALFMVALTPHMLAI